MNAVSIVPFTTAASAGIVRIMFGFVPDCVIHISDYNGTNPNIFVWANNDRYANWAAALSLKLTGSTGVVTRDTTGIKKYAGGKVAASEETADGYLYVDRSGSGVSTSEGDYRQAGIEIPADHQTAAGENLVLAFRGDM
jgi:hypothetical protein